MFFKIFQPFMTTTTFPSSESLASSSPSSPPPPQNRKDEKRNSNGSMMSRNQSLRGSRSELGFGRNIPIKQGYLLKRSNKHHHKIAPMSRGEWKKKFVALDEDGMLSYFNNMNVSRS